MPMDPSINEWVNKMKWFIFKIPLTMEYSSAMRKEDSLSFVTTWNPSEKDNYYMIYFIYKILKAKLVNIRQ